MHPYALPFGPSIRLFPSPCSATRSEPRRGSRRYWALPILALFLTGSPVLGQQAGSDKVFDGLFFGLEVGAQNYFGGARIGTTDVLTRDTRWVADLSLGYRKQILDDRLYVGLRVHYGVTDGDLRNPDFGPGVTLFYDNDSQVGVGGEVGLVLGSRRRLALFLYGYETERDFDVTITTSTGSFHQSDEQGVFRFGLGVELRFRKGFHVRGTLGTGRADFGDRAVSQDVDGRTDVGLGVVFQL